MVNSTDKDDGCFAVLLTSICAYAMVIKGISIFLIYLHCMKMYEKNIERCTGAPVHQ